MKTQTITLELYSDNEINKGTTLVDKINQMIADDAETKESVREHNIKVRNAVAPLFFSVFNKLATEIDPTLKRDKITIDNYGSKINTHLRDLHYGANSCRNYRMILNVEKEEVKLNDGVITKLILPDNISVTDIKLECSEYCRGSYVIDVDCQKFISDYTDYLKYMARTNKK